MLVSSGAVERVKGPTIEMRKKVTVKVKKRVPDRVLWGKLAG